MMSWCDVCGEVHEEFLPCPEATAENVTDGFRVREDDDDYPSDDDFDEEDADD